MTTKLAAVLLAPITLRLQIVDPITSATTVADCQRARCPVRGRIVGCSPVYGKNAGGVPFTDLDLMIENGTTDIFSAVHAVVDGSANTTTEPTVLDAQREVAEGAILTLDATTIGGTTPTLVGYGYDLIIQPME